MTTEQIDKFSMYINSEIIGIESKIINPDNLSAVDFQAYLLRYTFLFRLKNRLSQYCLNEHDFYKEFKSQHGISRLDFESETIYNKYFRSRTNRSYEGVIDDLLNEWHLPTT